jgi:hypothetical protein
MSKLTQMPVGQQCRFLIVLWLMAAQTCLLKGASQKTLNAFVEFFKAFDEETK